MICAALVQLNRPLDARKHLDRLLADEKAGLRPRTAALAAAVGEGLGKDGNAFVNQADESLAAYVRNRPSSRHLDDRISLVELRCWKAHRPNTPPNIVRDNSRPPCDDSIGSSTISASNDMLPGFVLDAVKQILPRERMNRPELQPIVKELQASIDRVTTDTFTRRRRTQDSRSAALHRVRRTTPRQGRGRQSRGDREAGLGKLEERPRISSSASSASAICGSPSTSSRRSETRTPSRTSTRSSATPTGSRGAS